MKPFSLEQLTLLRLTALSNGHAPEEGWSFDDVNFEALRAEANVQTVTLSVFERLAMYQVKMPAEEYRNWLKAASRISQTNYLLLEGQAALTKLLEEKGFSYTIIKGAAAAGYYPSPEHRACGDIDFLVKREEVERISELLVSAGYQKGDDGHECHILFQKNGVRFEMHFEPAGIPYGEVGEKLRSMLADAPSRAKRIQSQGKDFFVPDDTDHALVLLLHMQHHMLGEGIGLRHLCDWGYFVEETKDKVFWKEKLLPLLLEVGLYRYAQVMTATCCRYLGATPPVWLEGVEEDLCQEVMEDLLQGGNFGQKDELRSKSGMLISRHGKNGTKDGAGKNLLSILHDSVMKKYPVIKKFPPLYPFLFAWRALRYGVLMLFGKRDSIAKMLPEAEKRKKIYRRLHVFETQNNKEK